MRHSPRWRNGRVQGIQQRKEIGLGVVNPRTDEIEPPGTDSVRVKELLQYFDPDKIYLNPDCGFGTFAERNVNTHAVAIEKMKTITEAAHILRPNTPSPRL